MAGADAELVPPSDPLLTQPAKPSARVTAIANGASDPAARDARGLIVASRPASIAAPC
jgi:hypothetical protein